MNETDVSEVELRKMLDGCIFGKESAWLLFFERYHSLLTGSIYMFGRGKLEVDEVSQNVYESLLKNHCEKLRTFRGKTDAEFTSYLYQITKHITWNRLKAKLKYDAKFTLFPDLDALFSAKQEDLLAISESNYKDQILHAIDQLAEDQRAILTLRLEGFKFREIAKSLDLPLGTVLARVKKSRKNLKNFRLEQ